MKWIVAFDAYFMTSSFSKGRSLDSVAQSDLIAMLDIYIRSGQQVSNVALRELKISVSSGNYIILYGKFNEPTGFVVWANVSREALIRLKLYGKRPRYCYEWCEGPYILFLNIISMERLSLKTKEQILNSVKSAKLIAYLRKGKFKFYSKNNNIFYSGEVLRVVK
jgi:hemolysin-activating ACP:hemolysin acyltransferase